MRWKVALHSVWPLHHCLRLPPSCPAHQVTSFPTLPTHLLPTHCPTSLPCPSTPFPPPTHTYTTPPHLHYHHQRHCTAPHHTAHTTATTAQPPHCPPATTPIYHFCIVHLVTFAWAPPPLPLTWTAYATASSIYLFISNWEVAHGHCWLVALLSSCTCCHLPAAMGWDLHSSACLLHTYLPAYCFHTCLHAPPLHLLTLPAHITLPPSHTFPAYLLPARLCTCTLCTHLYLYTFLAAFTPATFYHCNSLLSPFHGCAPTCIFSTSPSCHLLHHLHSHSHACHLLPFFFPHLSLTLPGIVGLMACSPFLSCLPTPILLYRQACHSL